MRGQTARIGFLWPADGLNDDEYWAYLPPGVAWLTARYSPDTGDESLTMATIDAYAAPELLTRATGLLRAVRPHVIACGDNAASVVRGLDGDLAMRQAIEAVAHVPATTPGSAILAALATLGAGPIAVVSPYADHLSARLVSFLEAAGHPVTDLVMDAETEEWAIGLAPPGRWVAAARRLDMARAEAVVIAGGGVRLAGAIAGLERQIGRPVVGAAASLVWHACRLAAVDASGVGEGRLFHRHGGLASAGREPRDG